MLEREVKLGAGPAFHLPDLSGVVDGVTVTPPEAVRLETVYYDTADLRLMRTGVALRRRTGGEDAGWHLKLPAGAETRYAAAPRAGATARCRRSSRF